jgi:hypothetical protein
VPGWAWSLVGVLGGVLVLWLLRSVVRRSGPEAVERHRPGTPDGLAALRRLARLPG